MKTFTNEFHPESPVFAALASLREIFRDLATALPRWVLRGVSQILNASTVSLAKSSSKFSLCLIKPCSRR